MSAVERLRAAGFTVRLTDDARLGVSPARGLSDDQRGWIAGHRDALLAELCAEAANASEHEPDDWRTRAVTCGECWHVQRVAGHAHHVRCGVGALTSTVGWDTDRRTCRSFTTEPDPLVRECVRCTHNRPSPVNPVGGIASCALGLIRDRVPPRRQRCDSYRERAA